MIEKKTTCVCEKCGIEFLNQDTEAEKFCITCGTIVKVVKKVWVSLESLKKEYAELMSVLVQEREMQLKANHKDKCVEVDFMIFLLNKHFRVCCGGLKPNE